MLKKVIRCLNLICLLSLTTYSLKSQSSDNVVFVKIIDLETQESLPGATALNLNTGNGEGSDNKGVVKIELTGNNDIIEFSFLGFRKKQYQISKLPSIVPLEKEENVIENITIVSKKKPLALTKKSETILDFVLDEDRIIILSKIVGKNYVLRLTNLKGERISSTPLTNIKNIEKLYTSCFGSYFVVGRKDVLQLYISENKVKIADKSTRNKFDKYIAPCKTQNEDYIYYEERKLKNQIASIFGAHKKNKDDIFIFAGVADEGNLKRYKYDIAYMKYADGTGPLHLGIHARNPKDALQWGDMLNRSFYLPVDYFLMKHKNNILLFDHENCKLRKLTPKGKLLSEVEITYPKQKGWKSKDNLRIDKIKNKLYALHRRGQQLELTEINLVSGENIKTINFKLPFIEKLAVHDGILYYTDSSLVQSSRILNKIKL